MNRSIDSPAPGIRAHLSLWDAVSIIVGIVIGATIYETPPLIFRFAGSASVGMAVWTIAGVLCLFGALCYAEMATTYPRLGGDYQFLTRAYGSGVGFLYGWAQLTVIQTSSIGMMAYVFGDYAVKLWSLPKESAVWFALTAVAALAAMNIMGVVLGKRTQNLLTAVKVLGLGAIVATGFFYSHAISGIEGQEISGNRSLGDAFVLVFLAYGGWNDAAFVAAEMQNKPRNIPLALILGTTGVMFIYLVVNAAYLASLGFSGVQNSKAIAAEVLGLGLGEKGSQVMCVLVMVSALAAVNGLIFTSSRIYAALGSDHRIFARLGRWHPSVGSPLWSLATLTAIALTLIAAVGSSIGREGLNQLFQGLGLGIVSWEGRGGFETLLKCSAPIFWLFFLLAALSLFVLRFKDRGMVRPFSVPLFPIVPLIFAATCGYMLYSGIKFAGNFGLVGGGLLLAGVPLWLISRKRRSSDETQPISAVGLVGTGSVDVAVPGPSLGSTSNASGIEGRAQGPG